MNDANVKTQLSVEEAENHLADLLDFIGDDCKREGLLETPKRIVKSWDKILGGYHEDPIELIKTFDECGEYDQIVLSKDINFYSTCEHHWLPFFGECHIAYIPNKKIIGISKLARIFEVYARRLQVQERLGSQVVELIEKYLQPKGVAVVINGQHMCMTARGVEKANSKMVTSKLTGVFLNPEVRQELFDMINLK